MFRLPIIIGVLSMFVFLNFAEAKFLVHWECEGEGLEKTGASSSGSNEVPEKNFTVTVTHSRSEEVAMDASPLFIGVQTGEPNPDNINSVIRSYVYLEASNLGSMSFTDDSAHSSFEATRSNPITEASVSMNYNLSDTQDSFNLIKKSQGRIYYSLKLAPSTKLKCKKIDD